MTDEEDTQPTRPTRLRRAVTNADALRSGPREYPWDTWHQRALAAGVDAELAELGRAVMREADQHVWSPAVQAECGWSDDGEAMRARALAEPGAARARWQSLMDTDGAEEE